MRRLAMTGVCACALLVGCPRQGVGNGPTKVIELPCAGKNVNIPDTQIGKSRIEVHFVAKGTCKVTKFIFIGAGHDPPPGFEQKTNPPSATIIYSYKGTIPIPSDGYTFIYVNDDPQDGNGSGIVKN